MGIDVVGICGGVGGKGGCETNEVSRETTLVLAVVFGDVSAVVAVASVTLGSILADGIADTINGFAGAGGMTGLAS